MSLLNKAAKTKFLGLLPLFVLLLLGVVVRLIDLSQESLWLDETFTLLLSDYGLQEIAVRTADDNHPPLYTYFLHFWRLVFGSSAFSVRLPSVLFGVATVYVMYLIGRDMFSRRVGYGVAFFTAISPFMIWYSQETRDYAMMAFFAVFSFLALYRAVVFQKRYYWIAFTLAVAAMFYTHYFSVFFAATEAIVFFILWKFKDWRTLRDALLSGISAIILYVPWILVMWGKEGNPYGLWWALVSNNTIKMTMLQLIGGYPDISLTGEYTLTLLEVSALSLSSLLIIGGFVMAFLRKEFKRYVSVILFFTLPILAAYLITKTLRPMYHTRFFIYSFPFFFLALSYGLATIPLLVRKSTLRKITAGMSLLLAGIISALMITSLWTMHTQFDKEDWAGLTNALQADARSGDFVVSDPPYHHIPLQYHFGQERFHDYSFSSNLNGGNVTFYGYLFFYAHGVENQLGALEHNTSRIWLVTDYGDSAAKRWLETHYRFLEEKQFAQVRLLLYEK